MVQICVKTDFKEPKMCKYAAILNSSSVFCRFNPMSVPAPESHRGVVMLLSSHNHIPTGRSFNCQGAFEGLFTPPLLIGKFMLFLLPLTLKSLQNIYIYSKRPLQL